jgi:Zn-finger nucleic acid-binding protein
MNCPKGHGGLDRVPVGKIHIDRCPECGGTWYEVGELRLLKDTEAGGDYCWIDFDLWKDIDEFRAARQQRYACPQDTQLLTTVRYGDSPVAVDICERCRGVWLDQDEFAQIVAHLDEMVNTQSVGDYLKDIRDEFLEIFAGPEDPLSEMRDFGRVLYLLQLRFVIEHPRIDATLSSLPRL